MAFYCIVEGGTEEELYPFWFKLLRPDLIRVDRLEGIARAQDYCLESGYGHEIKERIKGVLKKIRKNNIPVEYFIVIVDSEETPPSQIQDQLKEFIRANNPNPNIEIIIFIQPICIEAWLLGNNGIYPRGHHPELGPAPPDFNQLRAFYDTETLDPETIPALSGEISIFFSVRAEFCLHFLRKLLLTKSKGRSGYRKNRINNIKTKIYFEGLLRRNSSANQLSWFGDMISRVKTLR